EPNLNTAAKLTGLCAARTTPLCCRRFEGEAGALPPLPKGLNRPCKVKFLNSQTVPLAQNLAMVQFVAGDDVGESAHAYLRVAGDAATLPRVGIEVAEKRDSRPPDVLEFDREAGDAAFVEAAGLDVVVLFKAGERGAICAGNAQRAIAEDALRVVYMSNEFLHAPFVRFIAEQRMLGRNAAQQRLGFLKLLLHRGEHVHFGNQRNIFPIIRIVFGFCRTHCGHGHSLTSRVLVTNSSYQISHFSFAGRTIGSPALHENALANSLMLLMGPITRYFPMGCGS